MNALLVFIKNPVLGKVKTRLADVLGPEKALEIYRELILKTFELIGRLEIKKFIFYSDQLPEDRHLLNDNSEYLLQTGLELGERMENAFRHVFQSGAGKAVIIGSDCPDLTPELINSAFSWLDETDAVIGPARDGGYYLLGLKSVPQGIFKDKSWSTHTVLQETVQTLKQNGCSFMFLPVLKDIDRADDL